MSLYLPQDLHPARMALSATTCLSMVTFFKGSQHGPKTSYIKAIGIWAALCCSIVFFCLIEYCFCTCLISRPYAPTQKSTQNPRKIIENLHFHFNFDVRYDLLCNLFSTLKSHTVRNLHFLSKNLTLISRNCRFFWVKNSRKCCDFGLFSC